MKWIEINRIKFYSLWNWILCMIYTTYCWKDCLTVFYAEKNTNICSSPPCLSCVSEKGVVNTCYTLKWVNGKCLSWFLFFLSIFLCLSFVVPINSLLSLYSLDTIKYMNIVWFPFILPQLNSTSFGKLEQFHHSNRDLLIFSTLDF